MIKNITSRPLWFNILTAILVLIVLFLLFMGSLRWITKHGDSKTVPTVMGKNIIDVEKMLSHAGFETVVQDSVYYDSIPPGVVVKQVPEADQVVKVNRTVYVVINRFVAPDISVPNLVGFSFRNAEMTLDGLGLKLGDTTYVPDFAKGSVKQMLYNGNPIKPGDKVKIGSKIDLVLAGGNGSEDMAVPKLIGFTLAEAKIVIDQMGLVLGSQIGSVKDPENAYIYRQNPMPRTADGIKIRIRAGQMVDVWLQNEPVTIDSSAQNEPPQTPQQ